MEQVPAVEDTDGSEALVRQYQYTFDDTQVRPALVQPLCRPLSSPYLGPYRGPYLAPI